MHGLLFIIQLSYRQLQKRKKQTLYYEITLILYMPIFIYEREQTKQNALKVENLYQWNNFK